MSGAERVAAAPATPAAADVIGIDLGTTNCAVAWAAGEALAEGRLAVRAFDVPQLVSEGELARHPVLPSFLFFGRRSEATPGSYDLPWDSTGADAGAGGKSGGESGGESGEMVDLVGVLARDSGGRVPGRLVASAKSWLSHAQVDRDAPILPWGVEGRRISPVDAAARYLSQIRLGWNHLHARADKARAAERQDVVVTVPASFDEVARELTVEAARRARFAHVTLLEEPQAALYAWIDRLGEAWAEELQPGDVILVVDIGGGTTDLSLIRVGLSERQEPTLERFAVGRHLLLGGDNMDLTLAHLAEERMGHPHLDAMRWQILAQRARVAKELLLKRGGPERVAVQVLGAGSSVVGGALSAELTREDVNRVLLDGFVPLVASAARPRQARRAGLAELGLPYEADPAITRHLADFLGRHAASTAGGTAAILIPNAVLFNGGALKGAALRRRILRQLGQWAEGAGLPAPKLLEGAPLDLAVARGAAYYGAVRRGLGVRIGGGSARAYYVEVELAGGDRGRQASAAPPEGSESAPSPHVRALCVAPRGMEEDSWTRIDSHTFRARANRPVAFRLLASTARLDDAPGDLLEIERASLEPWPPILTVLRYGKPGNHHEIPVRLAVHATAVGTLELWCEAVETEHRWRLDLQVRGVAGGVPDGALGESSGGAESGGPGGAGDGGGALPGGGERLPEATLERAAALVRAALAPAKFPLPEELAPAAKPNADNLTKLLPLVLEQPREQWSLSTARQIWQVLFELRAARDESEAIEARWLNLIGYCLRPGFGYALDDWRINELWKLFHRGTRWPRSDRCRAEWWTLWRRISGGLSGGQQNHAFGGMEKALRQSGGGAGAGDGGGGKRKRRNKRGGGGGGGGGSGGGRRLAPREAIEMRMAAAAFERIDGRLRAALMAPVLTQIGRGRADRQGLWMLARVGARQPLHGPVNLVLPTATAEGWIEALLALSQPANGMLADTLLALARRTGDRSRDIDDALRSRVLERLRGAQAPKRILEALDTPRALDAESSASLFGESLPPGLVLELPTADVAPDGEAPR
jgi:molecular chaperone DnaK (HSP70)